MLSQIRCIIVDDEPYSQETFQSFVKMTASLELVAVCDSAIEAGNILQTKKVDLIILDIDLPGMSGIDFLKSKTFTCKVILITAHTNFALEAFEYPVSDFLAKPVKYSRFLKAIEKVSSELVILEKAKSVDKTIYIRSQENGETIFRRVFVNDILWIKSDGDYLNLTTTNFSEYSILNSLRELEEELTSSKFIRIHRSYIINIDKVDAFDEAGVYIQNKFLPVGPTYKLILKEYLKTL
ncbi:MAG: LytTR family DNA-binding domain-containing protein [Chloroherpetonaceae bacterium]|nr:LytTR family DNA-binding domain-containing protein [Chloroherpetonaceae bacterium]